MDRNFRVHFNGKIGKKKVIKNGLPQGSVLSPLLFNVYAVDIVDTITKEFIYAYDVGLVAQGTTLSEVESTLGKDIAKLQKYFKT